MSEIRNEISKMTIRGELNLLFAMSKLVVTILDAAEDNQIACDTLRSISEGILNQAAYIHGKVNSYTDNLHGFQ